MSFSHDVIVVGAGLAGLRAAVECAEAADVAVISKVLKRSAGSKNGCEMLKE